MKKLLLIGIIGLSINIYSAQAGRKIVEELPRPLLLDALSDYDKIISKL
jgi:hypothetical protein